jgi:tetratricopeptide (TPR) repeat protein
VAGVVAFAGVISIAVVGKQVSASKRPIPPAAVAVEAKQDAPPAPAKEEAKPAEPQKAPAPEPAKVDDKKDEAKKDEAKPEEAKKDEAKPEEAKKDEVKPPTGDAEALKKETLSLLNRGKTKDAIVKAREAVAADPTDATSYLYLGSALQDSGKWKDGIEAYSECVRTATKGPVHECRAMGGHK